jgi:hypothetical protein
MCERVSQLIESEEDYERILKLVEEESRLWYAAVHLVFDKKFKNQGI